MYVFVTVILVVLIAGLFGAGFAFGCKLPTSGESETG